MNIETILRKKSVVIITHEYATGPPHALEDYLKSKVEKLFFIAHPFVFSKDIRSHFRKYERGKLVEEKYLPKFLNKEIPSIFKDLIFSFWLLLKENRYDIFIGVDSINVFTGVLFKKLGKLGKIIFYVIDFVPQRYPNNILNSVYHMLDRFAVVKSDYVWNLSDIMKMERERRGLPKQYAVKQILVPVGTENQPFQLPLSQIKPYHVAHMGHLIPKQGVQLIIEAAPLVIQKIPEFHIDVVGGGMYENNLKMLAKKLGVENHITFHGFIKTQRELQSLIASCAVGVATYVDSEDNYVRYTDPGKIKAYLASGLPVIVTKVPSIAKIIEKKRCGFAIDYDKNQLAKAIIKLLTNNKMLIEYRKNASLLAKEYNWDKIFEKALQQSL